MWDFDIHYIPNWYECTFLKNRTYSANIDFRLKPLDIEFMKQLHNKVNIVPVIAKADVLTRKEVLKLKKEVSFLKYNRSVKYFTQWWADTYSRWGEGDPFYYPLADVSPKDRAKNMFQCLCRALIVEFYITHSYNCYVINI